MSTVELNKHIISQPIAFLLGAGSSVPLGMPTSLGFRKVLFKKVPANGRKSISDLYEMAAIRYHIGTDDINLEEFLEYLHELRLALWILWRSDFKPSISEAIASLDFDTFREAELPVNQARSQVLSVLHDVCGNCDPAKADSLWAPIFADLSEFSQVFPVFTFNYDWVFENIAITYPDRYSLVDGFSSTMGGYWSEKWFADFEPSPHRTNICLFKLHGSTCWLAQGGLVKSLGSFAPAEQDEVFSFEDYQSPFEIVYPGYRREVHLGDEHWTMEGLDDAVFSTRTTERQPYSLLDEYFESWLSNGRILVIVGYAFGDSQVNGRIAYALQQNQDLQVLVLDPGSDVLWVHSPFEYRLHVPTEIEPRLQWLRGRFGNKGDTRKLLNRIRAIAKSSS